MIITQAIITGYILYFGREAYKEEKRNAVYLCKKKSTACLSKTNKPASLSPSKTSLTTPANGQPKASLELRKSAEEQAIDKKIKSSTAFLGLALAGTFFLPPLSIIALGGMAWTWRDVYQTAYKNIKKGKVKVEILDTIASISIIGLGYAVLGAAGSIIYFGSKKLLLKTEDQSKQKLVNIFSEQPKFVWIVKKGLEIKIPFAQLRPGDIISVPAGTVIPTDGRVVFGAALVNQQNLTGESQPIEKHIADSCLASTLVLEGNIQIEVEKMGSETAAAQVGIILNKSIDFKEEMISKGERLADQSTLPLLGLGIMSMPFIGLVGSTAIFNASFGYSLRMVSPVLMLNFLTIASNRGVLIKDGRSLELLNQIDTVVFDKTGTLTLNQPRVASIHTMPFITEDELLAYAAAAEYRQTHPIALAILEEAGMRQLPYFPIEEAKYEVGYGIKVSLNRKTIHLGSRRFMEMEGIVIPSFVQNIVKTGVTKGYSFVQVAINKQVAGVIELHPTIRPEAYPIVQELQNRGVNCYIISGDSEWPTAHLAKELNIQHYFAEVLPEDKAKLVANLQQQNKKVCFIGDGINDAIALKKADVSISLSGASTIATDTAQIVLMNENLKQIPFLLDLGKQFQHYMSNNVLVSLVPSVVTIGGAFFFHFGIAAAIIINQLGLTLGMANSIYPLLQHKEDEEENTKVETLPLVKDKEKANRNKTFIEKAGVNQQKQIRHGHAMNSELKENFQPFEVAKTTI